MQDDDIAISELEIQFNEASRRVVGFAAKLDSFNALYLYARYVHSARQIKSFPIYDMGCPKILLRQDKRSIDGR